MTGEQFEKYLRRLTPEPTRDGPGQAEFILAAVRHNEGDKLHFSIQPRGQYSNIGDYRVHGDWIKALDASATFNPAHLRPPKTEPEGEEADGINEASKEPEPRLEHIMAVSSFKSMMEQFPFDEDAQATLRKDPIFDCIEISRDILARESTITVKLIADIVLPDEVLEDNDATPETVAELFCERMELDINLDIARVLILKWRDHLEAGHYHAMAQSMELVETLSDEALTKDEALPQAEAESGAPGEAPQVDSGAPDEAPEVA